MYIYKKTDIHVYRPFKYTYVYRDGQIDTCHYIVFWSIQALTHTRTNHNDGDVDVDIDVDVGVVVDSDCDGDVNGASGGDNDGDDDN